MSCYGNPQHGKSCARGSLHSLREAEVSFPVLAVGTEQDLNRLPDDDAIRVGLSQFSGEYTGVLELDAMCRTVGKPLPENIMLHQRRQQSPREQKSMRSKILEVIFRYVTPRNLIDKYQCFGGSCCLYEHSSNLKMKAAASCETMALN
jgi:hypothetical protein